MTEYVGAKRAQGRNCKADKKSDVCTVEGHEIVFFEGRGERGVTLGVGKRAVDRKSTTHGGGVLV